MGHGISIPINLVDLLYIFWNDVGKGNIYRAPMDPCSLGKKSGQKVPRFRFLYL